jgi:hypothetical protein
MENNSETFIDLRKKLCFGMSSIIIKIKIIQLDSSRLMILQTEI